jgi:hypothetical protein
MRTKNSSVIAFCLGLTVFGQLVFALSETGFGQVSIVRNGEVRAVVLSTKRGMAATCWCWEMAMGPTASVTNA